MDKDRLAEGSSLSPSGKGQMTDVLRGAAVRINDFFSGNPEAALAVPMALFGMGAGIRAAEIDIVVGARILSSTLLYCTGLAIKQYLRIRAIEAREYSRFWD